MKCILYLSLLAQCAAFLTTPKAHTPSVQRSARSTRHQVRMAERPERPADDYKPEPGTTGEEFSKSFAHPPSIFTVDEHIRKILPHRYPLALVDKVIHFEAGKRAVGIKCITNNEPQFTGHFPDRPIMPGVLQVEAMAQLCGIIALQQPVSDGQGTFFFGGVEGVKWRKPVTPGDVLVMEVSLLAWKPRFGIAKMTGKGYVDGKLAVEVKEFTFALVKDKEA